MLLVLTALLPMVFIGGVLLYLQSVLQQTELQRTLRGSAQALSLAVDREVNGYTRVLQALADDEIIDRSDLSALRERAQVIARDDDIIFIAIFTPEGKQVFNSATPPGGNLAQPLFRGSPSGGVVPDRDPSGVQRALTTGRPANSSLFHSAATGKLIFTVSVPVIRDGAIRYVLNAGLDPQIVSDLVTNQAQFRGTPALVVDSRGVFIARSSDGTASTGQKSVLLQEALRAGDATGADEGINREGDNLRFAYHRSRQTGWTSAMTLGDDARAAQARTLLIGGVILAIGVIVALFLALLLASRIRSSVSRLAAVAKGEALPAGKESSILEITELEVALEQMAASRSAELLERERRLKAEIQREEAATALRERTDFLAILAHELRNPLGAIANCLSLLETLVVRKGLGFQAEQPLQIAHRQIQQITRMVDDLLDLSRLGLGKLSLEKIRFDLRQAIGAAIQGMEPRTEARAQTLMLTLPPEPVEVMGDEARLSQVFMNLLDNASKFSPEGTQIDVSLRHDGNEAVIRVKDQGPGIDPRERDRLFLRFVQSSAQGTRPNAGLGIGLALCKSLVERHGGSILVESAGAGEGSTFIVRLPTV